MNIRPCLKSTREGINWNAIIEIYLRSVSCDVEWIYLRQNMIRLRDFVITVITSLYIATSSTSLVTINVSMKISHYAFVYTSDISN
jgi:hypothetical protein